MTKRREFIMLLGGAMGGWPLATQAQRNERARIGVMMSVPDDQEGQRRMRALREGLEKLGWSESKNIRIEVHWSVSDRERAFFAS